LPSAFASLAWPFDSDAPKSELSRPSTHAQLSKYLSAPIFDLTSYGTVADLIDHQVKIGAQDGSFLVTDLTAIIEQYD
jgi:ornithine decarboxylase